MDSDVIKFIPQNLREWARINGELIMLAEQQTAEELSRTNPKVNDTFGQEAKKIAKAILPNGRSSSFISKAIANARKVLENTEEEVVKCVEALTRDGSPLNQIAAGRLDAILASAITDLKERLQNTREKNGKEEPPVTEEEVAETAIDSMEAAELQSLEGLNHLIEQGEDVPALLRALARARTTMYLKQQAKS